MTISVHGHKNLGMAVASFLAAVEGGARQLEVHHQRDRVSRQRYPGGASDGTSCAQGLL